MEMSRERTEVYSHFCTECQLFHREEEEIQDRDCYTCGSRIACETVHGGVATHTCATCLTRNQCWDCVVFGKCCYVFSYETGFVRWRWKRESLEDRIISMIRNKKFLVDINRLPPNLKEKCTPDNYRN